MAEEKDYLKSQSFLFSALKLLSEAVDAKDQYTKGHSIRVKLYSLFIGEKLNLDKKNMTILSFASELHDIGKIKIIDEILKKPGALTADEKLEIFRHPIYSIEIIGDIPFLEDVKSVIISHHEFYDGSGYPLSLSGEKIPLLSRIITVADVFDAMTSKRVYRKRSYSDRETINFLRRNSGKLFDKKIVDAFIECYEDGLIYFARGEYYMDIQRMDDALNEYKKSIERLKDKKMIYLALLRIGEIYNRWRNFNLAIEYLKRGMKKDNPYLKNFLVEISASYYYKDSIEKMNYYVEKALKEELPFGQYLRTIKHKIIYLHRKGKPQEALELYRELESKMIDYQLNLEKKVVKFETLGEETAENLKVEIERSHIYDYVARIMKDLGFLNEAELLFEKSIELKTLYGDFLGKALSLGGLTDIYIFLKDYKKARDVAFEALKTSKLIKNTLGIILMNIKLCEIYSYMKDKENAKKYLLSLQFRLRKIKDLKYEHRFYYVKGVFNYEFGNIKEAIENFQKVLSSTKNRIWQAFAKRYLGLCYENIDKKTGIRYLKSALETFEEFSMRYISANVEDEIERLKKG
uniref:HD domain-containing protein n=1 Tax=candidate division WOR-3 bacterium TaxID=2052148 RepID=A0A7C4YFA9_UNCW3